MVETLEHATVADSVQISAEAPDDFAQILTPEALDFVADLARTFEPRRKQLLQWRDTEQQLLEGRLPDFLHETRHIRGAEWKVARIPGDLQDRRVEITGPVERKMMINALNSGASVFMADFEDAHAPTWDHTIQGQINCRDAVNRTISFVSPEGKAYRLNDEIAVLMVRPRGWHLLEKHVLIDGEPVSASLFDFGLFAFHNTRALMQRGTGPYFYLAKIEHFLEARLWNDVFIRAQEKLGIPRGTVRATVLIETVPAAFQMDEILWELREHSAGLNCGRWDYIFSIIKKFRNRSDFVLPDRSQVTMTTHMMHSYSLVCIRTCHRRGIHAIGGMSAYIPVKSDSEADDRAMGQVVNDKVREAGDGHDGTWVAHPALVPVAKRVFDEMMAAPNQIERLREDVQAQAPDLLTVPQGTITEAGLRTNVNVGIRYLQSWLNGQGAAAINNLMEDAATSEISRAQIWQWLRQRSRLEDGREVTRALVDGVIEEELEQIRTVGDWRDVQLDRAASLFREVATGSEWVDFLTVPAYAYLA
jgi:malate synthase